MLAKVRYLLCGFHVENHYFCDDVGVVDTLAISEEVLEIINTLSINGIKA